MVDLRITHTIATQATRIVEYTVTLADGRKLPDWISFSPDGTMIINRPADIETVGLSFRAIRADGTSLGYSMDVNTLTGEIERQRADKRNFGPTFFQALENTQAQSQLQQQQANTLTGNSQ